MRRAICTGNRNMKHLRALLLTPLVAFALLTGCSSKSKADLASDSAKVASELLAMVGEASGPVVIVTTTGGEFESPFTRELAAELTKQATAAGRIADPVGLPISPDIERSGQPVQKADFLAMLKAKKGVAAIFALSGVPLLTEGEWQSADNPAPIFVATEYGLPYADQLPATHVRLIALAGMADPKAATTLEKRFRVSRKP